MADGIAVLNHIFAFRKVLQGEFVSGRYLLVQDNFLAVYYKFSPAGSATMATATLSAGLIFKYFVSIYCVFLISFVQLLPYHYIAFK